MAMALIHVCLVNMHLHIVQQFINFTENIEKASLFLSVTSLYKLFSTNVASYKMYDIPRLLGQQTSWSRIQKYLRL